MEQKIKFAVVGCGRIGKRHATLIQHHPECELVALCDILPFEEMDLDLPDIPYFSSLDKMLSSSLEMDVISICTPNGYHAEQAMLSIDSDKHVVIEKPMGLNKRECEAVIFKGLNASKHIFIVMQNRYSPPSEWLKEMVHNNRLGQIRMVQINCYWNRDDHYYAQSPWKGTLALDGGVLFTQFSHFIDIMYWIFGDIENIKARFQNFNHQENTEFEDSGIVHFDFVKGGMGCIQYSTSVWGKNMESSMLVIGEKGSVKIGGQYMDQVEYCHIENYEMPELALTNPPNDYGPYKGSAANHIHIYNNVVDVLKGRKSITTNALEGMKVTEIIERIYQLKDKG